MPNGVTHKGINGISIIPVYHYLIEDKDDSNHQNKRLELFFTGSGIMCTSKFPDKIEPAIHPNHREFYHSLIFGAVIVFGGYAIWKDLQFRREERKAAGIKQITLMELIEILLIAWAIGIILHLLADGFTPKGLPLY